MFFAFFSNRERRKTQVDALFTVQIHPSPVLCTRSGGLISCLSIYARSHATFSFFFAFARKLWSERMRHFYICARSIQMLSRSTLRPKEKRMQQMHAAAVRIDALLVKSAARSREKNHSSIKQTRRASFLCAALGV